MHLQRRRIRMSREQVARHDDQDRRDAARGRRGYGDQHAIRLGKAAQRLSDTFPKQKDGNEHEPPANQ